MNPITNITNREFDRQRDTLNLIASENYPSPAVLALLGSVWQNKYAEGYPGKRYYAGNANSDELETMVQQLALQVFDTTGEYGVNVQVLSGSPANATVFLSALDPGDTVMSLDLAGGGHLSHLHPTSAYLKYYQLINYGVSATELGYEVDLTDFKQKLAQHKPKLVIIGFSAYPSQYKFDELIKAAHDGGALVLADIAHIAGLVASGHHDSPFRTGAAGADYVTMTTHKTLRGPRGAMLFAKTDLMKQVNATVFPGTSGGPHLHQIAAIGQSLLEVTGAAAYPDNQPFEAYIKAVLANTLALEAGLNVGGLEIVTKTSTHLTLVKLPDDVDSFVLQQKLEGLGLITNRNQIPHDLKTPWRPSGLRLGTAALTSRGLQADDATAIGRLIAGIVTAKTSDEDATAAVKNLLAKLKWYY
ncbi:serine hydroxymethyltransferase [Candidatus Saccharibacteria bacterium]|nr:serine hydroxymethyltransferase [Candidatus Saccharibacteria bacterium]